MKIHLSVGWRGEGPFIEEMDPSGSTCCPWQAEKPPYGLDTHLYYQYDGGSFSQSFFPVRNCRRALKMVGKWKEWCSALCCSLPGPSIAVILPEIFLLYVTVITFFVASTVTFQPTKLIQLKSTAGELFKKGKNGDKTE